ncbi:MAG: hypothetical protein V7K57_01700, partial [Nostoc sp.]|uniref:hypothetical protein n=1 Tax=Nostoc sp. TaxID=1180 RepID=UPI002FF6DD57
NLLICILKKMNLLWGGHLARPSCANKMRDSLNAPKCKIYIRRSLQLSPISYQSQYMVSG